MIPGKHYVWEWAKISHFHSHNFHFSYPGGDPVEDIMLALLRGGGRLDVRDSSQLTPLQRCITTGVIRRNLSFPCLRILCQAGASLAPDEFSNGKWVHFSLLVVTQVLFLSSCLGYRIHHEYLWQKTARSFHAISKLNNFFKKLMKLGIDTNDLKLG